jgi:hypothetical protein
MSGVSPSRFAWFTSATAASRRRIISADRAIAAPKERGLSTAIRLVDIGACLQQQRDDFGLVRSCGDEQCGFALVAASDVGSMLQEQCNGRELPA